MEWIFLEIAAALGLAVFIVWYTMGGKPRREDDPTAERTTRTEPQKDGKR